MVASREGNAGVTGRRRRSRTTAATRRRRSSTSSTRCRRRTRRLGRRPPPGVTFAVRWQPPSAIRASSRSATGASSAPTASSPSSRSPPAERGDGRRTYVHVDGLTEPIVASRSERAILADVEAALDRGRRDPAPAPRRQGPGDADLASARSAPDYAHPPVSFYVTTPIYYVNAEPHLGHAYSTIAADVLARHHRQRGEDVFFLTGTDEHGEPVALAAEREGITPQELADRNAPRFRGDGRAGRRLERLLHPHLRSPARGQGRRRWCSGCTTTATSTRASTRAGTARAAPTSRPTASSGPDNTCPIHEIPLEREREENWFFRLSAFEDDLKRLYAERPDFVVPDFRRNEALSFIERGLQDVSLSRPKLKWGMPLPWEPEPGRLRLVRRAAQLLHRALLRARRRGPHRALLAGDLARHRQGHPQVPRRHLAGVPARRRARAAARDVYVHGYLLMGEKKMSKSLGNVLDPNEVVERFGADALRFYCFREVSFGQDGSVSAAGFETRYETELANDWGNLASRTLAMIERYRDGVVPDGEPDPELGERRRRARRLRRRGPRAARPGRAHPGAGGDLGPGPQAEPLRRGDASPGSWRRTIRRPSVSTPSSTTSPRASACWRCCCIPTCPRPAAACSTALAEGNRELDAFGARGGGQAIERIAPLFPKLDVAGA